MYLVLVAERYSYSGLVENTVILISSCDSCRTWVHSRFMMAVVSPLLPSVRLLVISWIKLSEVSRLTSHEATSWARTHTTQHVPRCRSFHLRSSSSRENGAFSAARVRLNLFSGQLFLTMPLHSAFHMTSVSWDCSTTILPGFVICITVQVWKWLTGAPPGELLQRGKHSAAVVRSLLSLNTIWNILSQEHKLLQWFISQ